MRKYFNRYTLSGAFLGLLAWLAITPRDTIAGIIQAIIPAAVPTANKQGNSSLFQLSSGAVTNGHCGSFDGNGNIVDSGVACAGSTGATPGSTYFSSTSQAGPSNTASETSVIGTVAGSTTIPANTFLDGGYMRVESQGYYSLPAVADSLTLKLKCGSTVLGSATTTLGAGVLSNGVWRLWLGVTAIGTGAGGAFNTNGIAEFTGAALVASEIKVLNTSNVSYNFTTSCVLNVTAQWGGAQSGESIIGTGVVAYVPGAPVTSVGGLTGAVAGEGNGSKVQLFTGSDPSTNDCAKFDSNHNVTGSGTGACNLVTSVAGLTGAVPGGLVLREQRTASTSASLNFTTCISSSYDDYVIRLVNVVPASNAVALGIRVSTDGGATYDATNGRYPSPGQYWYSAGTDFSNATTTYFTLTINLSSNSAYGLTGSYTLSNPLDSTLHKLIVGQHTNFDSGLSAVIGWNRMGEYNQAVAVNAFQVLASTGNLASGTVRCYGVAKQ